MHGHHLASGALMILAAHAAADPSFDLSEESGRGGVDGAADSSPLPPWGVSAVWGAALDHEACGVDLPPKVAAMRVRLEYESSRKRRALEAHASQRFSFEGKLRAMREATHEVECWRLLAATADARDTLTPKMQASADELQVVSRVGAPHTSVQALFAGSRRCSSALRTRSMCSAAGDQQKARRHALEATVPHAQLRLTPAEGALVASCAVELPPTGAEGAFPSAACALSTRQCSETGINGLPKGSTEEQRARDALCDSLYRTSGGSEHAAVAAAIAALRTDDNVTCVVTGQQCGFLGGPAYTLHKALHAVHRAAELSSVASAPVIAIFWLCADDHDYKEAAATGVFAWSAGARKGSPEAVKTRAKGQCDGRNEGQGANAGAGGATTGDAGDGEHCGVAIRRDELALNASTSDLRRACDTQLGRDAARFAGVFERDGVGSCARSTRRLAEGGGLLSPGVTLTQHCTAVLRAVCARFGLLILDPTDPTLPPNPALAAEVEACAAGRGAASLVHAALAADGTPTAWREQYRVDAAALGAFVINDRRERVAVSIVPPESGGEPCDGQRQQQGAAASAFCVAPGCRGEGASPSGLLSSAALMAHGMSCGGALSPRWYLRPLCQDMLLPSVAYIAGAKA